MSRAVELLGSGGPFARNLANYESRPGQLEMTEGVERALTEDRVLFSEAGTGTGKTLAYLVPAILSGRKVVVSTATRALQEQIFTKDLPLIARTLGVDPRAAMMKGLSNYLCRRRYRAFRGSADATRPQFASSIGSIEAWARETDTGDLGELAGLGEDDPVFPHVASSSETRVGPGCPHYAECFVTRMKRDAEDARLLVVNHHLFFADLALRGPHPGHVIPDYDAVIFDEAHQLEDIATMFFGIRVSTTRFELYFREIERTLGAASGTDALLARGGGFGLVTSARAVADAFWQSVTERLEQGEGRERLEPEFWLGERRDAYHRLDDALEAVGALAAAAQNDVQNAPRRHDLALLEGFEVAARRATALRDDLSAAIDGAPGRVTWAEVADRKVALSSSPIDVAPLFRERIFDRIPAVVLTSATLASGTNAGRNDAFRFLRARLGVPEEGVPVEELIVASPFDYERSALLYLPEDLPDPNDASFGEAAVERTAELVEASDGGAFVLTTSVRAMRRLHRGLCRRAPGYRYLLQGDGPKAALIGSFKSNGNAVLVATMSFWQGVDVPGPALRLVVLDKIPFPVPSDPIVLARSEALEAAGRNAFMDLHVPTAKIALKQGFGRLIRTRTDCGVVALLDGRVHRRGYGKPLLHGLPPAIRTRDIEDVRSFFERRGTETRVPGDRDLSIDRRIIDISARGGEDGACSPSNKP